MKSYTQKLVLKIWRNCNIRVLFTDISALAWQQNPSLALVHLLHEANQEML